MLGTQRVNKSILWSHNYLLEVIPVIPVDTEAVSLNTNVCQNTNARVGKTLSNCDKRNQLTDMYCVDYLLSKVSSELVTVRSCLSTVERVARPCFKNYLNPNLLKNNYFLCIPLCDGIHFQGYVVNSKEKRIIYFDSLRPNSAENPTSEEIATILFGKVDVLYESYFTERKQYDTNSCGVLLTAVITSFILQLPVVTGLNHAFDICFSLLERETPPNYVKDEIPAPRSVNVSSDKQMKTLKNLNIIVKSRQKGREQIYFT